MKKYVGFFWNWYKRRSFPKKQGVSLIEILLAAGVLAAVMVPVMITFGSSNRGIVMTVEEFLAHTAGIELLEQTMAVPFSLLPTGTFTDANIQNDQLMDARQSPMKFRISPVQGLKIEREMAIVPLYNDQNRLRFKKVDIRIHFFSGDGKQGKRTISLKGLLANEKN